MSKLKERGIISGSIRHQKIVWVVVAVVVAFGIYALVDMKKDEFPTFTIRQGIVAGVYPGERELIHFDMYRLNGADELFDIGWEDYLRRNAVLAVEWSENVEDAFDGSETRIRFEKLSDTERRITVEGRSLC